MTDKYICFNVSSKLLCCLLFIWHQMKSGKTLCFQLFIFFDRSGKRFSNEAILFHAFLAITLCSKIMTRCVAWFLTICEQHANWILLTNKSSVNGRGPSLLSAFDLSVSANLMKTMQHVSWLFLLCLQVFPQPAFNTSKYEIYMNIA